MSNKAIDVNSNSAILSAVLLGTLGVLSFIVQPGLVQAFVTELAVGEPRAVDLAGIEMLGLALATIILAVGGTRLDWRHITLAGLVFSIIGLFRRVRQQHVCVDAFCCRLWPGHHHFYQLYFRRPDEEG